MTLEAYKLLILEGMSPVMPPDLADKLIRVAEAARRLSRIEFGATYQSGSLTAATNSLEEVLKELD